MSPAADRRKSHRTAVDLYMNRYLDGEPFMCRATDISRTGIRLEPLIEPDRPHRYMGLEFRLPGSDRVITASGEAVVDLRGRTVGIRFTRIAPEHADLIDDYARPA